MDRHISEIFLKGALIDLSVNILVVTWSTVDWVMSDISLMWPRQVLVLLFEQQDRIVATIEFIYAGIYK